MLSIIIPSYKDKYLQPTIDDIRKNARGEIEIIVIFDGYRDDAITGATVSIHNENRRGLRDSVNSGVAISRGEYLLKCDSHCMFDEGFDVKLLADIEDDWVVIPRRYKLDTEKWIICEDDPRPIDYEKLTTLPDRICGQIWPRRANNHKDILVDETMVFQGSCWVMSRKHWDFIGELQEEGYGTFTQEPIEIALKTWLGGGKVMVNKKTWYAHQHRKFGRTHRLDSTEVAAGNAYSRDFWLNNRWERRIHDFEWLIERFK
ncbi:MAG: glycosyltransferase [Candidatus Paceibacterota bacterium]